MKFYILLRFLQVCLHCFRLFLLKKKTVSRTKTRANVGTYYKFNWYTELT